MATRVGDIFVNLKLDRSDYDKGLRSMGASAGRMGAHIGRKLAVGLAGVGFGKFIKDATKAGASLNAMGTIIDASLPHMTKQVDEFAQKAGTAFGLSQTQAKGFVGKFASMASAMGYTEKEAYNMSTALTGLAGDVASYYHITQDEAFAKLGAVFTGETESLKQLGVIMTQSALDAYALENGYGKVTAKMSELEKTTLRYNFVMDRLKLAHGDFAKYSNTWSGSLATLKLNWSNFMATIGQGLINILLPLLQMIAKLSNALSVLGAKFLAWSKAVRGIKSDVNGALGKKTEKQIENTTEAVSGVGSGLDGAGDSAKKTKKKLQSLKRELMGFDKITKLSGEKGTSKDSGTGGIGGEIQAPAMAEVPSSWAEDYASGLVDKLCKAWANKDFTEIGSMLARKLNESLRKIDWNSINNALEGIAKSLATFLSGFIRDTDWGLVARTISNGIASAINTVATFMANIDWQALGRAIVNFIAGIDWGALFKASAKLAGALIGAFEALIKGVIETAFSKLGEYFKKSTEEAGGNIIAGLLWGIVKAIKGIGKWIKENIFDPFIEGFKSAFGIASPSKVMETQGHYIIAGLIKGLKQRWTDVTKWIKDHIANFTIGLQDKFTTAWNSVKSLWLSVKDRTKNITIGLIDWFSDAWSSIKSVWNGIKDRTATMTINTVYNEVVNTVKSGGKTVANVAKKAVKNTKKKAQKKKKADGGIFANGHWQSIAGYATGGEPNEGQLFYARERGAELIGQINGHTAVMNNDQIVASVSNGVARALQGLNIRTATPQLATYTKQAQAQAQETQHTDAEILTLLRNLLTAVNAIDLDVTLDGESIKNNTVRRINQHTRRTGQLEILV